MLGNIYQPNLILHLPMCPINRGSTISIMTVCVFVDLNFLRLKKILANSSHFLINLKDILSQGFMMNKLCFFCCFTIAPRVAFHDSKCLQPPGIVAPVILEAKLLLQDLCKQKANWDSVISKEVRVRWSRWLEE